MNWRANLCTATVLFLLTGCGLTTTPSPAFRADPRYTGKAAPLAPLDESKQVTLGDVLRDGAACHVAYRDLATRHDALVDEINIYGGLTK